MKAMSIILILCWLSEDARNTKLTPYLEKMGNCELVLLGGDHAIYEQRPEECGDIVLEFINGLDVD